MSRRVPAESGSHKVSAVYPIRQEAEGVRQRLIDGGIAASAVDILHDRPPTLEEGSDEVLKDMVVDGAIGTAVGTVWELSVPWSCGLPA